MEHMSFIDYIYHSNLLNLIIVVAIMYWIIKKI